MANYHFGWKDGKFYIRQKTTWGATTPPAVIKAEGLRVWNYVPDGGGKGTFKAAIKPEWWPGLKDLLKREKYNTSGEGRRKADIFSVLYNNRVRPEKFKRVDGTECDKALKDCPLYKLFMVKPPVKAVLEGDPIEMFLSHFDRKHINLAAQFPSGYDLAMLHAMENIPGMYELIRDIPYLGYVLVWNHKFVDKYKPVYRRSDEDAFYRQGVVKVKGHTRVANIRRLIKKKRLDIARDLELVETKGQLKRLAKVRPQDCQKMAYLRGEAKTAVFKSDDRRLSHLKRIGDRVANMYSTHEDRMRFVHQDLLEYISSKQNMVNQRKKPQRSFGNFLTNLNDTTRMLDQIQTACEERGERCPVSLEQLRTKEDVQRRHNQVIGAYNQLFPPQRNPWNFGIGDRPTQAKVEFPDPPFPGTDNITPITDQQALSLEGSSMHHCVGSYARQVSAGDTFIYHVEANGEKATLQLSKRRDYSTFQDNLLNKTEAKYRWTIGQFHGPCNQYPSDKLKELVNNWLEEHQPK